MYHINNNSMQRNRAMIFRNVLSVLLIFVIITAANAAAEEKIRSSPSSTEQTSTVPGEGDIAIMQKEIKWGMQEMQRYKTIRGAWPVRMHGEENTDDDDDSKKKRGKEVFSSRKAHQKATAGATVRGAAHPEHSEHSSYWNLLVSVF